jgi:hypothetical protein
MVRLSRLFIEEPTEGSNFARKELFVFMREWFLKFFIGGIVLLFTQRGIDCMED